MAKIVSDRQTMAMLRGAKQRNCEGCGRDMRGKRVWQKYGKKVLCADCCIGRPDSFYFDRDGNVCQRGVKP